MSKNFIIYMDKTIGINGTKPKSVIIDGNLHNRFKLLCKGKSMKIGGVIEDLIKVYLHDPNGMQHVINAYKDEVNVEEQRKYVHEALKK
jgi:hypothetical protein